MATVRTYDHGTGSAGANAFSSQGYGVNGTIYVSGQYAHDMAGAFVGGDLEAQTRLALENLDRVLAGFGVGRSNLAEVVVYLTNVQEDLWPVAALFQEYIGAHRPAVTGIGVTGLAFPGQLVEIRAVAHTD